MFYQMSKDLTKRVGDGHDNYFLLPTEQKAHMNQLREWMFKNGYINKRDQKITTEYMSKILKKLQNIEGTKGLRRAAHQYFTDKEKNFIINYLIDCLVENQPFDCSSLGPNKYLNE